MCVNNMGIKQNIAAFRANPLPTYLAWKARWFVRRKPYHIHYFDLRESEAFQSDAAKGFGSGVTVTYAALQMAYYMGADPVIIVGVDHDFDKVGGYASSRSEEHTSELQSLMRISYAVFCLTKKIITHTTQ